MPEFSYEPGSLRSETLSRHFRRVKEAFKNIVTDTLSVSGAATVGTNLTVGADATVGDDLDVVGDLTAGTIASDTTVSGGNFTATGLQVNGNADVTGNFTAGTITSDAGIGAVDFGFTGDGLIGGDVVIDDQKEIRCSDGRQFIRCGDATGNPIVIQRGTASGTTDASGDISVTFPIAFSATPQVKVERVTGATAIRVGHVTTSSATGFTYRHFAVSLATPPVAQTQTSFSSTFDWIAIGPVANASL